VKPGSAALARRIAFPLRFAGRRVAAARRPLSVAALGVALAACALAVAFAAAAIVENRAVADAIDGLPPRSRDVEVTWVGRSSSLSERPDALDRKARAALETVGLAPDSRTLVYQDSRLDGQVVGLMAADDLGRWFVLRHGRLPRACTSKRCETLAIGNGAVPRIAGFPVVGTGEPRPGTAPARALGTATPRVQQLVAEGVAGAADLPRLGSALQSYTWSAPLASAPPTAWSLSDFERNLTSARTRLQAESFRFGLTAPLDSLDDVALDARVSYRRLLLVGAECAVLFLLFAVVAASSLRSSAFSASQRLRRFGARRWQADLLTGGEAAAIVVPATVVGWAAGTLGAVVLAAATDTPVADLLERTILSPTGLALAALLAVLAVLILFATMRARPLLRSGGGLSPLDAFAGGALLAVAVALTVGRTDPEELARDRGTGIVLLLVPALLIVTGAILAVRLAGPALRLAERAAPRTRPSVRLALLAAARRPGTQLATVGFLVVSVGLAVFATTYRSTLLAGERDQAAFAVPLDYTVRKSARGRPAGEPSVGATLARRDGIPVIRRPGEAPSLDLGETVDVLGIPSGDLQRLSWRGDFADVGPEELGNRIAPPSAVAPVGPRLPDDARELRLPVALRGDPVVFKASIRTPGGTYVSVDLGEARRGRTVLATPLPAEAGGGTLVGLTLEMPPAESFSAAHAAAEGSAPDVFSVGNVTLGLPSVATAAGSKPAAVDYRRWVSSADASRAASAARGTLPLRYLLTRERAFRIRPRQPTDDEPLRVIACDSLADRAGDGVIPLTIGSAVVRARVLARAARFPSLRCPFVVADVGALETAVSAEAPGAAVADEAWVGGPDGLAGRLERAAGPTPVVVTSRRAVEAELRDDPLARGTVAVLAAGSFVALVLALLAILLVVSVELRDESGDYLDLESQGMPPASLRRQLALRVGSLAGFGVLCGLLTGALLTAVVTRLVAVGAGRAEPVPPLRPYVAWPEVVLGLLGFAVLLGLVLRVSTRRAFTGRLVVRGGESR
jgi:hypothetical protein